MIDLPNDVLSAILARLPEGESKLWGGGLTVTTRWGRSLMHSSAVGMELAGPQAHPGQGALQRG